MSNPLDFLANEYLRLAKILDISGTRPITPNKWGDGSHVEWHQDKYHLVTYVERRNGEFSRQSTTDTELILKWLFNSIVFNIASNYSAQNSLNGGDCRRHLFSKELELLAQLNAKWAEECQQEIEAVLANHPYDDKNQNRSKASRWIYLVMLLVVIIGILILAS